MKEMRQKGGRGSKVRQLVRLNSRISRLSSELETLQFLQDRLEMEIAPSGGGAVRDWEQSTVKMRTSRRMS